MTAPPRSNVAALKREARANLYFALYASLGANRSLRAVVDASGSAGVPVSQNTLERYSSDFHWQERVRAFDEQRAAGVTTTALESAIASDIQHATLGRSLQHLASLSITAKVNASKNEAKPDEPHDVGLSGAEIARLADVGVRIERLASGKATEIRHVMVGMYGILIGEIGRLWSESLAAVHAEYERAYGADPNVRERAHHAAAVIFGPGTDRVIDQHFRAVNIRDVEVGAPEPDD